MRISVVTVCFNSAKTIEYALASFFQQQHQDKELIVIDGGSTDETLSMVTRYSGEGVVVVSEIDRGIYDGMNKGLRIFSGDAVGFLNSDDRFTDEHALDRINGGLEKADIVFGDLDYVRDHQARRVVRRWRSSPFQKRGFARGWMPPHPTFYVRRAVVDALVGFDLSYRIAADYDFMLRAMELHDFRTALIDHVLVDMMLGGESTAGLKAYALSNFKSLRSRQTWLGAGAVDSALIMKPLSKVAQFFSG